MTLLSFTSFAQSSVSELSPEVISLHSSQDILKRREDLIDYIWGASGFPTTKVPNKIDSNIHELQYESLYDTGNLLRIDKYTIQMNYGFESYVYHFHPIESNNKLFLYHAGHGYGFQFEDRRANHEVVGIDNGTAPGFVIPELLKAGYSVLAFSMPLEGNNIPSVPIPGIGLVDWGVYWSLGHEQIFKYLPNPYSYFFDPIAISLNYIKNNFHYERINMVGLSGGGWTTTLYSAIDTRINLSFPVAGSIPLNLRLGFEGLGDAEEGYDYNGILGVANYKEFYLMGSQGANRGQLQILHKLDPCCFYGATRYLSWVDSVKLTLNKMNSHGHYNFFLEEVAKRHSIGKKELNEIFSFANFYENNDTISLVISEPTEVTKEVGESAVFEIECNHENAKYQWQVDKQTGNGFEDIVDSESLHYEGTQSPILKINSIDYDLQKFCYRCKVSGNDIPTSTSFQFSLFVPPPTPKQAQTISFAPLESKTFGDSSFFLSAESTSGLPIIFTSLDPTIAIVHENKVSIVGSGLVLITANQPGNVDYDRAIPVQRLLIVASQSQTIVFDPLPEKTFGDTLLYLNATASSGLPITYSTSNPRIASVSGNIVTILTAGTVDIIASQIGDPTHNPAADVIQSLKINKAKQIISFNSLPDKTFGDAPFDLQALSSSGLQVVYTSLNPSVAVVNGSTITFVGVGTAVIEVSQPGDPNYDAAIPVKQPITIKKQDQKISFHTLSEKKFGDPPFDLGASVNSPLPISYTSSDTSIASISGIKVSILRAGKINITASQPGDSTYNPADSIVQSFTIKKVDQTIVFNPFTISTRFGLVATASSGLPIQFTTDNPSVVDISGNVVTIKDSGTASITASQSGNENYNAAPDQTQSLTTIITDLTPNSAVIDLYPNPTAEYLIVRTGSRDNKRLTISKIDGRLVDSTVTSQQEFKLDLTDYSPGIYLLMITVDSQRFFFRFVKL